MKDIINVLAIICVVVLSIAYFVLIYNSVGFTFTPKCLFAWGLCLTSYTALIYLINLMKRDGL